MPSSTRGQAARNAQAVASAASVPLSPNDVVHMHRQAAINARIANQAARNAQAQAISQLQLQAQTQPLQAQAQTQPRRPRNTRINIEDNPKIMNDIIIFN